VGGGGKRLKLGKLDRGRVTVGRSVSGSSSFSLTVRMDSRAVALTRDLIFPPAWELMGVLAAKTEVPTVDVLTDVGARLTTMA